MLFVAILIGLFGVVSSTEAQVGIGSGVVISPGQPPILVTPTGDGTVAVLRPGQESFWFRPPQSVILPVLDASSRPTGARECRRPPSD